MRAARTTVGDSDMMSELRLFIFRPIAAMALIPATASAQFNTDTIFGGSAGAGIGGVIGSQIAGSGNRTEGAVIGAVVGGLAGSTLANSQSNTFNGRSNTRYSSGGFVPLLAVL